MKQLPSQYVLSKFYTYSGEPVFRKFDGNYNASCPVCREGKSWLKKKRLYFYPTTNSFYCFNCNKSWNALNWITEVSSMSREEVFLESQQGNFSHGIEVSLDQKPLRKERSKLPHDSINLFNSLQQNYYLKNDYFKKCLDYVNSRRMNTAVNSNGIFYISLTDSFHGNRLCIPYLDRNGKIIFYQTRSLDGSEPRYLNKIGCDKSVFNIDRIDINLDKIFLFEGPIDAMFVKNGVSLAGLTITKTQEAQLNEFVFHEKIWILDNPQKDEAAKEKVFELLKAKQKVFRWPTNLPYKDFNEWAVKEGKDEIPFDFIVNSLY